MKRSYQWQGFTLVELLVVISIASILLTIASVNFGSFISLMRVRNAAFDLVSDLNFARSEAVKRNATITVMPALGNWTQGWKVNLVVVPGDPTQDQVLLNRGSLGGNIVFVLAPTGLTFDGSGRVTSTNVVKFQVCPPASVQVQGRQIRIDPSGQSRSSTTSCV